MSVPAVEVRVPPHSVEAEHALLGCMMLSESAARSAMRLVVPEDFYRNGNAKFFQTLVGLLYAGHSCDPVLVAHECDRTKIMEDIGGRPYLASLVASVADASNVEHYARVVRQKSLSRTLIRESAEMARAGYDEDPPEAALDRHRLHLTALAAGASAVEGPSLSWKTTAALSEASEEVAWLWRGYVAKGLVTLVVAQPKAGKSTWVYAAVAAMERGDAAFCGQPVAKATAIVLSEEPASSIRQKVARFGVQHAVFLDRSQAFPPRPLQAVCEAASKKAREVGADVVVVDTYAVWAHLPADAEKDAGSTAEALAPLLWLASIGMAVVLVHHMKKADGEDGTSVRGSSALLATVDVLVELRRFGAGSDDDDPFARVGSSQRAVRAMSRFDETPEEVVIDLNHDGYAAKGTASQARASKILDRVVAFVCESGRWVTTGEVQAGVGGKKQSVLHGLRDAVTGGRILRKPIKPQGFSFAPLGTSE